LHMTKTSATILLEGSNQEQQRAILIQKKNRSWVMNGVPKWESRMESQNA
jgi:hypothetical protein